MPSSIPKGSAGGSLFSCLHGLLVGNVKMMRHWFIILLVCCIEYPSLASCDTLDVGNDNRMARHDCSSVLKQLRADVRNEETRAIPLQTPGLKARDDLDGDAGKPCADFERVKHALHGSSVSDIERGLLGGKRAAVLSDGPHGSGHYWQLTLAVQMNDQVVGACLITKTAGWRNIPAKGLPHFGQWHSLSNDRFRLWSELVAGESQSQSLIIPLVFRHVEDHSLAQNAVGTHQDVELSVRLQREPDHAFGEIEIGKASLAICWPFYNAASMARR